MCVLAFMHVESHQISKPTIATCICEIKRSLIGEAQKYVEIDPVFIHVLPSFLSTQPVKMGFHSWRSNGPYPPVSVHVALDYYMYDLTTGDRVRVTLEVR